MIRESGLDIRVERNLLLYIFFMLLKLSVITDLKQLLNVQRFAKSNQPVLLNAAAKRYVQYLRNRFISLSSRPGTWPKLAESTIKRKIRVKVAVNPKWILRESDTMLNSLGIRTRGNQVLAGFVRDRPHPRAKSVNYLVKLHSHIIESKLPYRPAIGSPNNATRKRMTEDIRDEYNRVIRRNKKR